MEIEYYSNCCEAPPISELYHEEEYDAELIGECMQCRDKAILNIIRRNMQVDFIKSDLHHILSINDWKITDKFDISFDELDGKKRIVIKRRD